METIFLDRDGVINRNRHDYVKSWNEFEFLPGVLDALRELARLQYRVVVITNQSAINRGIVTRQVVEGINRQMMREVEARGGRIDAVYYCPHRPDENCKCRKPKPGLLFLARDQLGLDWSNTILIGDHISDILAARAAGCEEVILLSGRHETETHVGLSSNPFSLRTARDLPHAVDLLISTKGNSGCSGERRYSEIMKNSKAFSLSYLDELERATRSVNPETLEAVVEALWFACNERRTVYICGNGGSAATASHFAVDLGKGTLGTPLGAPGRGFKAISLADNLATSTAWANDTGYENVFAGQLDRLLEPRDVVIGISVSGRSPNVLAAVRQAKQADAITVAFTGGTGGQLAEECHHAIVVDSSDYGIVEDVHMILVHILTQYLWGRLLEKAEGIQQEEYPRSTYVETSDYVIVNSAD